MRPRNVLVVHFEAFGVLEELKRLLEKHKIPTRFVSRNELKPSDAKGTDLIVSVGGDGTFLATARHIEDGLILGINSKPDKKEGHFTRATLKTLKERFEQILADKFTVLELTRLQATLDKKDLPLALNEVFVAHRFPHHMSIYKLNVGGKIELQKSSGIIIGTAMGSHAWLKSAGGTVMPTTDSRFQFLVRDPFQGRVIQTSMTRGILEPGQTLTIESLMNEGIVAVDGADPMPFKKGSVLNITTSEKNLKFIDFSGDH